MGNWNGGSPTAGAGVAASSTQQLSGVILLGPAGFGPRGLPIGNLTSQWFANIVGNCLDQHIKHELRCRRYIRYMDDWVLVSGSRQELQGWLLEIQRLLANLGLVLNPKTHFGRGKACRSLGIECGRRIGRRCGRTWCEGGGDCAVNCERLMQAKWKARRRGG